MAKKKKQPAAEPVQSKELIAEEELASADGDVNIVAKAWDFLSSMKLGIVLLLVLALVSIVGTIFIPKNPVTGQQDFVKFYNNWFFRILMATLALNLLVCSLNRLRHIAGTLRGPKPMVSDAFLRNLKTSDAFQIKEESGIVALKLRDILRRKGYRTFTDSTDSKSYVAADRGRWGILGPYLSHISFFIMIVAILVKFSGLVGFEGDLAAVVGKTHNLSEVSKLQNVGPEEYFDLRLDNFRTVYNNNDPNQGIKDWYSDVTVIDKDKTFPFTIEVNRPLVYKDIKFYQMSYGFYFAGKASSAAGGAQDFNLLTNTANSYVQAPGTDIIFLPEAINPVTKKVALRIFKGNQEVAANEAELNKPFTYETASVQFTDARDYSFFSVKRDPTVPYMGVASILLIVAITYSFLVKHHRIWAVVEDRDGLTDVRLGGLSQKHKADFQKDFAGIIEQLKGEQGGVQRELR